MGRNPLWKDMRWEEQDDSTFFNIRIPRELRKSLREIAEFEGTTISFLIRRQLITLVRKKNRDHNIKDSKLPRHAYPGPRHQRPKRNRTKAKMVPDTISDYNLYEGADADSSGHSGTMAQDFIPEHNGASVLDQSRNSHRTKMDSDPIIKHDDDFHGKFIADRPQDSILEQEAAPDLGQKVRQAFQTKDKSKLPSLSTRIEPPNDFVI